MHLAMICTTLPNATGGGPRMNQWAVCDEARRLGHAVTIVWITQAMTDRNRLELQALANRGVGVVAGALDPSYIAQVLTQVNPDVIYGLTSYPIAWTAAYHADVPRVCHIGDPEHLVSINRRQYVNRSVPLTYAEIVSLHNTAMLTKSVYMPVLESCAATFCPCAASTDWFNSQGLDTQYIPAPVVDPAFPGWRRREEDMPVNEKPRILLIGHLNGIATISGLTYLAEDVLPYLDVDEYDWRICGGESLTPDLKTRFKSYPQIKFKGFIEDIRKEILQADILLVPTPETMGVRTRIHEGWSLGACIVAHVANGVEQPEAKPGENILLGENGSDIAALIRAAVAGGSEFRCEVGNAGRETFDEHFTESPSRIIRLMEGVA
jgi:hypothetical protein